MQNIFFVDNVKKYVNVGFFRVLSSNVDFVLSSDKPFSVFWPYLGQIPVKSAAIKYAPRDSLL